MGQTLADRVLIAKSSDGEMNDLLREYRPFILSAVLTNSPKAEEDYVQAGMLAFAQAVRTFEPGKGSFLSFAKLLISRRVIDCIRQDTAHPELPLLDQEDEESRSLIDVVSRHTYDLQSEQEARREEILLLTQELREWSLSFQDLSAATPRHASTRKACKEAVRMLLQDEEMLEAFRRKKESANQGARQKAGNEAQGAGGSPQVSCGGSAGAQRGLPIYPGIYSAGQHGRRGRAVNRFLILEINEGCAALLTADGEFRTVPAQPGWSGRHGAGCRLLRAC